MSSGFEEINTTENEEAGGPEITRGGYRFVLDTSNNQELIPFLGRNVFQRWLSNNQGVDSTVPLVYSISGKCYIRDDVYRPEAELEWYRQKEQLKNK